MQFVFLELVVREFPAMDQTFNVTINLVADDFIEGVEVFGLSVTNNIGGVNFQFGESDFPSTVINLIDRGK